MARSVLTLRIWCCVVSWVWGSGCASSAFAAEPLVEGNTTCPDPMAVEAEVFRLTSPNQRAQHLSGARVRVVDSGDTYDVEIEKDGERLSKTYSDPARECEKRVRFAAVYVVMTLMPPDFDDSLEQTDADSVPAVADESANASERVAAPRTAQEQVVGAAGVPAAGEGHYGDGLGLADNLESGWLEIELGMTARHSLSTAEVPRIGALGGELLGALGGGFLAFMAALELAPVARFELGEVQAKMSEATARSGLRLRWLQRDLSLATDIGLLLAWRRLQGEDRARAQPETRVDVGGQLGFTLAYRWGEHWAPIASLRTSLFPEPVELLAHPRGRLGKLPHVWFGALIGVRFML